MMKYNQFGHATDLPAEPPLEEHPFWEEQDEITSLNNADENKTKHDREFRGMIKERKEWQKPQDPSFDKIFQEKKWLNVICRVVRRYLEIRGIH